MERFKIYETILIRFWFETLNKNSRMKNKNKEIQTIKNKAKEINKCINKVKNGKKW